MKYPVYYEVRSPDGKLRFSSVYVEECQAHVTKVFHRTAKKGRTGVICSISEHRAKP